MDRRCSRYTIAFEKFDGHVVQRYHREAVAHGAVSVYRLRVHTRSLLRFHQQGLKIDVDDERQSLRFRPRVKRDLATLGRHHGQDRFFLTIYRLVLFQDFATVKLMLFRLVVKASEMANKNK